MFRELFFTQWSELLGESRENQQKLASGLYHEVYNAVSGEMEVQRKPKNQRALCGARTRAGGSCKAKVVFGGTRCRMHGGLSTGPKTKEGRARIAESNRRRAALRRAQRAVTSEAKLN